MISPFIAGLLLTFIPIITLFAGVILRLSSKYMKKEMKIYELAGRIAYEAFNSIRTVHAFNLQSNFINHYGQNHLKLKSFVVKKGLLIGLFSGLAEFLLHTMLGLGVFLTIHILQEHCNENTKVFGHIIACVFCMWNSTHALGQVISYFNIWSQSKHKFSTNSFHFRLDS